MSPEQTRDMSSVDERSDIYSLGVVALEMFTGATQVANISQALREYPRWLSEAIEKACSHKAIDRFRTAHEFIKAISHIGPNPPNVLLQPGMAFCSNMNCPEAQWTYRGYLKGPHIIDESNNSFCTACGSKLVYECQRCSVAFSKEPFCGNCGEEHYSVPKCDQCGSLLENGFIGADTKDHGCGKCQRATTKSALPSPPPDFDDDIPF